MVENDVIENNKANLIGVKPKKVEKIVSTRHLSFPPDTFDPNQPRLGRRESEPHSHEVSSIHDVLTVNFPDSRTLWDLHHYFNPKNAIVDKIDLQFDISFFLNWKMPHSLASYKSEQFEYRIPTVAINILSKSTWKTDFSEHLGICELLKIPVYIIYPSYNVASKLYSPPFLRAYILVDDVYIHKDLRKVTLIEGGKLNSEMIIDLGNKVPFRIGLMKRKRELLGGSKLYNLIIIDKKKDERLLNTSELKDQIIVLEKARAEKEKARAEKEKARAEKEKARADAAEESLRIYHKKFGNI